MSGGLSSWDKACRQHLIVQHSSGAVEPSSSFVYTVVGLTVTAMKEEANGSYPLMQLALGLEHKGSLDPRWMLPRTCRRGDRCEISGPKDPA